MEVEIINNIDRRRRRPKCNQATMGYIEPNLDGGKLYKPNPNCDKEIKRLVELTRQKRKYENEEV